MAVVALMMLAEANSSGEDGWLYVPTGNLFDAEQGATAKTISDAFGISKEWVRLHYRSNKRPTSRPAALGRDDRRPAHG